MAGYHPTQIRKPSEDTDFETKCVILFKELLNDPNVSRIGTNGQGQDGVDIKGHRDRDPNQLVGVQCKLKFGHAKLKKSEIDDEVKAALNFIPALKEYFIVTTSKNDTKLQQHALALMQAQQAIGRGIHIEVWGWDTLEEKINQYESVKDAFDPGFSPALAAQNRKLDALAETNAKLATKEDVAALAKSVERNNDTIQARLPPLIADRLLREEFSKALKRRGFKLIDTPRELATLAIRTIDGDLAQASPALKAEICERAARANASPETFDLALRFRHHAAVLDPSRDLFVVDAYLKEVGGDTDAALRELKTRDDIDVRSALFSELIRWRGTDVALEWASAEKLRAADFTAPSAMNLIVKTIENGEFDKGWAFISELPSTYFDEVAALHLLRAQLALASILPPDQKSTLFEGLPINPRLLQLASGPNSGGLAKAALADLETLIHEAGNLGIAYLTDFLSEFALWLRLEIPDFRDAALARLAAEIGDTKTTLRRVRLALAYNVPFDTEAMARHLVAAKNLGGWTSDERFAAFLIAYHSGDATAISNFLETHRDDLFAQTDLARNYLAAIEIESLARAGRFDDARRAMERHRGQHLTEDQIRDAEESIIAIENDDEVETHRRRYEETGNLTELRILVGGLRMRRDTKLLSDYAPILARKTLTREDFDAAIKSLYQVRRDAELLDLANDLPDLVVLDLEYTAIKGWSLYRLGRSVEARAIARDLLQLRNEGSDRELAVNTAIETGDWGHLQAILAHEISRIDILSAKDSMRLARLAFEIRSPYVDQFRNAALAKAPDDPQINLSAYMLAMERSEESQGTQAQEWFQKAAQMSGPDGPVQSFSFREIIDRTSGWRERTDKFDRALRNAEMPVFMVARAVRRHLLDLTLGQARRNLDVQDRRVSYPVFAFSGAKTETELDAATSVALDITAVITLNQLGLLDQVLSFFQRIVVAPRMLSFLFAERQFIRVQQPSEVAKARRLRDLIASGRLKVLATTSSHVTAVGKEIGHGLAALLQLAKEKDGLVVRSAPVTKLGSYLDETADMSAYTALLVDTVSVLAFLSNEGKVDTPTKQSAERYLRQVDCGWSRASPILHAQSSLYLDDLAVTYLDHVGVLDVLTRSVAEVFIHGDLEERAKQTQHHSEHADALLAAIEQIRASLSAAIEGGRVSFSARRLSDELENGEDKEDDPLDVAPTLDLITNLAGVDAAIADDRCLNKLPNWTDADGRTARSLSTLDVLASLHAAGEIDNGAYWLARHRLRRGGFYAMPLAEDELIHHLANAPIHEGAVRETPELKAVRESIALPLINDCFLPPEVLWLAGVRHAIYKTIRQTWLAVADADIAAARADWLMSVQPNPLEWCADPDNDAAWSATRQQAAMQVAILMVFPEVKKARGRKYCDWLESKVIEPFRKKHPDLWEATLAFLKSYLVALWKIDDGQG
jgi:hypothetical protein